ncbi:MAG: NADH:ubiquinone reductase (Na(+)-transporting) subunit C [Tannerella sp.]|jgi:Na+-transporting NADH:ubiquinone oxidoreductase subunit C|nr:NADH:ubiquinone reductase (Na(+)-transporting) subunit C [Tannerella sp.]
MNRDSNVYTILYASVMVVLVAILLAFTSEALRDRQKLNEDADRRQQILRSIHVSVSSDEAEAKYSELIREAYLVNDAGEKTEGDAFAIDALKAFEQHTYPVFEAVVDGETKYVMALRGKGLWGAVWGYISVDDDRNTVFGADFSHAGETPGLGAEIATPIFTAQFRGKQIFKDGAFRSIAVVKPGRTRPGQDCVDGISGGTLTSNGVNDMLFACLESYTSFLKSK